MSAFTHPSPLVRQKSTERTPLAPWGIPVEIGGHDLGLRHQPPAIGGHTREILVEPGLTETELAELESNGTVAAAQKSGTNLPRAQPATKSPQKRLLLYLQKW